MGKISSRFIKSRQSVVHLKHINSAKMKILAESSIINELADKLTFKAPDYKHDKRYKKGWWNGDICLLDRKTGVTYSGLAKKVLEFCKLNGYSLSFDDEMIYSDVSEYQLKKHIESLKISSKYEVRDYQFQSVLKCLRSNRRTLISPTSSGKSMIIYIIASWYLKKNIKTLIIVPTTGLVKQMESDFRDYGFKGDVNTSLDGLDKTLNVKTNLIITTWQSIAEDSQVPKEWFNQFGCVFVDEAHKAKAKTLIKILSNLIECKYRFGTTGTLDGQELNENTIFGLFGPPYKAISTVDLIDRGYASKFQIKCIVLHYPKDVRETFRKLKLDYHGEIDFLVNYKARNEFVKNLSLSLPGNKLLFFKNLNHGNILYNMVSELSDNVYYIDGSVEPEERERIRKEVESQTDSTLIASLGTTSTGVSINRLDHMIAASPSKSKVLVLQSIGRMLRLHEDKNGAIIYDIVDNLGLSKPNFTMSHFEERKKIYNTENFEYKIYNVEIKESK